MPEAKDDLKREKVRVVPISNIEDFPDHPFQVKDDESIEGHQEPFEVQEEAPQDADAERRKQSYRLRYRRCA